MTTTKHLEITIPVPWSQSPATVAVFSRCAVLIVVSAMVAAFAVFLAFDRVPVSRPTASPPVLEAGEKPMGQTPYGAARSDRH